MKKEFEVLKTLGIDNWIEVLWINSMKDSDKKNWNLLYRFNTTTGQLRFRGERGTEENDFLTSCFDMPPKGSDDPVALEIWRLIKEKL